MLQYYFNCSLLLLLLLVVAVEGSKATVYIIYYIKPHLTVSLSRSLLLSLDQSSSSVRVCFINRNNAIEIMKIIYMYKNEVAFA